MNAVNRGPFENAGDAVARWAAWIDELAEHPLDPLEWQFGMLECRDAVGYWVEATGDLAAADLADEVDARFKDLTEHFDDGRYGDAAGSGWWWRQVPRDADSRAYMTNYGRA